MVLLTSSTISVAISSSIICVFTFLLFMSGYVVQQQTVRSLQNALHAPPPLKPTPTLPPQFQKLAFVTPAADVAAIATGEAGLELGAANEGPSAEDVLKAVIETASSLDPAEEAAVIRGAPASTLDPEIQPSSVEVIQGKSQAEPSANTTPDLPNKDLLSPGSSEEVAEPSASALPLRLAYVLTVTKPSQICSALLFFRQHSQSHNTANANSAPTYLLLYPSRWETDPSHEAYTVALSLMRVAQDALEIVYHPVRTTETWAGLESASVQSQLLGELQRYHWAYDRMLYLKTPGLAMDVAALDAALSSTSGSLRRNWVSLSKTSAASRDATDPPIMLLSEKGLLVPRGELRGRLAVSAATGSHVDRHVSEMDLEAASKIAAYMYFSPDELEHAREGKGWYGSVFEKYERGVDEVCKGSVFDVEKGELRRR